MSVVVQPQPVTVGSTFSGIEGMGLAATRAGMHLAWSCEINADCRQVIAHHFPAVPLYEDITQIGYSNAPVQVRPVELLCGGFPCQDLSVAGRRAGLEDGERSSLFFEFARVADELAPTWIVLENVPGLLSSKGGRDMGIVLGTLGELGYGWAYRVLDAQNFGVAQRRRRVVIVGCLGEGWRAGQVLFEPEGSTGDSPPRREKGEGVAALTSNGVGTCGADDNQAQAGHLIPDISNALTASRGQRNDPNEQTFIPFHLTQDPISGDVFPAMGTGNSEGCASLGVACFSENQRAEVLETPYARQITTGGGKPGQGYPAVRNGMQVRRLTPTECERLQGFPDSWTDVPNAKGKPMVDSARYRMLGNAVAVPVFEWVFNRIAQL